MTISNNAQPPQTCICGKPSEPGTHRIDGPCYVSANPAPAETATPTPETDAVMQRQRDGGDHSGRLPADFARKLECDLNKMIVAFDKLREQVVTAESDNATLRKEVKINVQNGLQLHAQLKSMTDQFLAVSGELGEARNLLGEVSAVIEQRGVGHVVMYSDRITPLLPRIRAYLAQSDSPGAGVKGEGL